MEDLLAEIERKRKSIEDTGPTKSKNYIRRGDIINEEKDKLVRQKIEKEAQKAKEQLISNQLEALNPSSRSHAKMVENTRTDLILPRDEVIRLLRAKNLPIRLFGETDADSCHRLKLSQIMELDDNKELTNEFQDTLEKIDKAVSLEHYNVDHNKKIREFLVLDSETTIESIKESAKLLGKSDDTTKDCEVLLSFIHLILSIWARDLNRRPLDVKLSLEGRRESARYEQTCAYVRPLLKQLKKNTLSSDILKYMTLIIHYCLEREYIKANDAYLQMAIGNAPWPIGVTMVGIHPRTGRERISSQHVAHVLNDETQRKYIQGVKRLMSYCQKTYPTDPSRSVEYGWVEGKFI